MRFKLRPQVLEQRGLDTRSGRDTGSWQMETMVRKYAACARERDLLREQVRRLPPSTLPPAPCLTSLVLRREQLERALKKLESKQATIDMLRGLPIKLPRREQELVTQWTGAHRRLRSLTLTLPLRASPGPTPRSPCQPHNLHHCRAGDALEEARDEEEAGHEDFQGWTLEDWLRSVDLGKVSRHTPLPPPRVDLA